MMKLPGVVLLQSRYKSDERGYFLETYNRYVARNAGVDVDFVRDVQSGSFKRGTVRGLHFQAPPRSQAKLVRVVRGRVYDVVVDLRVGSPTYGKWSSVELTSAGEQLFVPRGFAHGFCTLEVDTTVLYKLDEYYAPDLDQGLIWDDPTLAIKWPVLPAAAIISDRDLGFGSFADFVSPFRY
jgi:dTDP-4-dehydrorhamnose 3,5-epimerase